MKKYYFYIYEGVGRLGIGVESEKITDLHFERSSISRSDMKLEETMAFGDGGNDISMLRHAAIGIAMGQAKEDVKAAADYVTASIDEDGISKAMKHFGII